MTSKQQEAKEFWESYFGKPEKDWDCGERLIYERWKLRVLGDTIGKYLSYGVEVSYGAKPMGKEKDGLKFTYHPKTQWKDMGIVAKTFATMTIGGVITVCLLVFMGITGLLVVGIKEVLTWFGARI